MPEAILLHRGVAAAGEASCLPVGELYLFQGEGMV
jgi:hypothetical protein